MLVYMKNCMDTIYPYSWLSWECWWLDRDLFGGNHRSIKVQLASYMCQNKPRIKLSFFESPSDLSCGTPPGTINSPYDQSRWNTDSWGLVDNPERTFISEMLCLIFLSKYRFKGQLNLWICYFESSVFLCVFFWCLKCSYFGNLPSQLSGNLVPCKREISVAAIPSREHCFPSDQR